MPADPKATNTTGLHIDHETHTLRFTRDFNASRESVFAAWTKPEHVTYWWDATGAPLAACTIDLRPGGSFAFVTATHPDMPFSGTYSEIKPPERLVFTALGSIGRVGFQDIAGKTRLTVDIVCQSTEHLNLFLKMGVDVGTSQTLSNLVAYVQRQVAVAT